MDHDGVDFYCIFTSPESQVKAPIRGRISMPDSEGVQVVVVKYVHLPVRTSQVLGNLGVQEEPSVQTNSNCAGHTNVEVCRLSFL